MNFSQHFVFSVIIVLFSMNSYGEAIRTKDKMYENIDASKACFRRLNATHQIGCTSKRGGSTGVIHYCRSQADLDFILKNGTAPPYVPIIPTKLFTVENVNILKSSPKIAGLVLYATEEKLDHFSHEQRCPNPRSSVEGTCDADTGGWNRYGTGLQYHDIPFPMFFVENEESVAFARECFEKHNNFSFGTQRDRSLCSLQLTSFMYATADSSVCIRRSNTMTNLNSVKVCEPLGDRNAWASLFPLVGGPNMTEPTRNASYIVVATRLDTTSLFDKTEGAISPVTGLVALLATAKYLKAILPSAGDHAKNVLFVVFNGETYDYIGSQRFVYEMSKGNFPSKSKEVLPAIAVDDIDLYVEFGQLNKTGDGVVGHYLANSAPLRRFVAKLHRNKGATTFHEKENSLPPASLHTFLKHRADISGLVLADHRTHYNNPYYNSVYDNATNLNYKYMNISDGTVVYEDNIQRHIVEVSTMVAKSLYQEITGEPYLDNEIADVQFVDELFHCYLENANCLVHQAVQRSVNVKTRWDKISSYILQKERKQPFSLYVGVESNLHFITTLVGLTLGWVTGDITGDGNRNCTNEGKNYAVRYYNMSLSLDKLNTIKCYRITMNLTEAISPAFIIDGYEWSSGEYSSWTESVWGDIKLRVFLKPSAAHENMTIAIGSMVLIFSLLLVYFVKSRSHILFTSQSPTLAPPPPPLSPPPPTNC